MGGRRWRVWDGLPRCGPWARRHARRWAGRVGAHPGASRMRPARALLVGLLLLLPSHVWAATAASRNFDGADNSRVDFGDQTFFDNLTTFSVSFWLYLDSQANNLRYISKWGDAVTDPAFVTFARPAGVGDEVGLAINDGDGTAAGYCIKYTSAANLATGTWYHVLATW